jgi:hypothetical protein
MIANGFLEGDAPAEPSWDAAECPQAMVGVFAVRKSSAGASPSRPSFSLVKMKSKIFSADVRQARVRLSRITYPSQASGLNVS